MECYTTERSQNNIKQQSRKGYWYQHIMPKHGPLWRETKVKSKQWICTFLDVLRGNKKGYN
jgi:hypothetical protein